MSVPTSALGYIVNASLAADILGEAIKVRQHGELTMMIQVPSVSALPNGLISLQGNLDGSAAGLADQTKWKDIPGAFSELLVSSAGLLVVKDLVCIWYGLNCFEYVRLKYKSTSGGAGNYLSAQYRAR